MDTSLRFCLRHTLHAMRTRFKLQSSISAFPIDLKGDQRVSSCFTVFSFDHFYTPSFGFTILGIHTEQIAGKDISFIASGGPADLKDTVVRIVRIFGHQQQFQLIQIFLHQRFQSFDFSMSQFS